MRLLVVATAALGALVLRSSSSRADELSSGEALRLLRGETVPRAQAVDQGDQHYVGGVTYTIVDGRTEEVQALLADPRAWRHFVPMTRGTRFVGMREKDPLVEVTHEVGVFHAEYTMRVHREGDTVRFWVDLTRPHDVQDAWGFFRAEALGDGRTLVTYGVLIDLGAGLLRDLFEERVREVALKVPEHVRGLLEQRRRSEYAAVSASDAGPY